MRISQLAKRTGVPATTLRFYESAGLLPAERTSAGHRVYGDDAVERLFFIKAAKHLGLPLAEIAALLEVWESGPCAEVKAELRPRIAARLSEAEQHVAELTSFAETLRAALDHLDTLPDRLGQCELGCGLYGTPPGGGPVPVDLTPPMGNSSHTLRRSAPVACSLTADDLGERAAQWRQLLNGAKRLAIRDGVRLTLPIDRVGQVAVLAADEQRCCPFFDFRLHLDGPRLRLEVRAPAEGASMLADLFDGAH